MATFLVEEPDRKFLPELPPELQANGEFLLEWARKLQWGDLSDSIVMDVGCGVDTLKLFKTVFPQFQKVIAIDKSVGFINYLQICHHTEKIEYFVADITNRSTLTQWEAQMAKITSFYCFNCLADQKTGFENIHYMLRPGGEAIILTGLKNPHFECAKFLLEKPRWNKYQHLLKKFPEFRAHSIGFSFYQNMLKDLDFEIICCEENLKVITFNTEEEFRASFLTRDKRIALHLPLSMQTEFREQYAKALMELNGKSPEGQLYLRTSTARIVIKRKDEIER